MNKAGRESRERYSNSVLEAGVIGFLKYLSQSWKDDIYEMVVPEAIAKEEVLTLRKELGWTQAEMAEFFGVAQSTVNAWELESETIQAVYAGVLRALEIEVARRAWTLKYAEWAPFTKALREFGVQAYLETVWD